MKLENQVAMIVGLGSIGKAIASRFSAEGAKIALVDIQRMKPELDSIAKELKKQGGDAITFIADATDEKQMTDVGAQIFSKWGRIDILINSTGYRGPTIPTQEITVEEWDKVMAINLKSPFICSKVVLKYMLKQKSGSIVSLNGTAGKEGLLNRAALCAAKFGLTGLTRVIAKEAGPYGIRANVICPSGVIDENLKTTMEVRAKAQGTTAEALEKAFLEMTPLRKFAQPEEVAKAALFLASSDSSHTTGEALNVSGGEIMY